MAVRCEKYRENEGGYPPCACVKSGVKRVLAREIRERNWMSWPPPIGVQKESQLREGYEEKLKKEIEKGCAYGYPVVK